MVCDAPPELGQIALVVNQLALMLYQRRVAARTEPVGGADMTIGLAVMHLGGTEVSVDPPIQSRSFLELLHRRGMRLARRIVKHCGR
jgi:hypothetical protein